MTKKLSRSTNVDVDRGSRRHALLDVAAEIQRMEQRFTGLDKYRSIPYAHMKERVLEMIADEDEKGRYF